MILDFSIILNPNTDKYDRFRIIVKVEIYGFDGEFADCSQLQLTRKLDVTGYIHVDYCGTGVNYCGARAHVCSITILQIPTRTLYIGTRATHTRDPVGEFRDYISLFRMATRATPTQSYVCN